MFYSYTKKGHLKIFISIISFSTYPIKLQLFQLTIPTTISALKGLVIQKKEKIKEREQKSQKRKKKQPSPYF